MNNSKAYIWTFIGKFGGQAINLVLTMILARLLTPEAFGMVGVLSIIFVVANTLVESGLGGALIMEPELNKKNCGTIFLFNAIVSLSFYSIIFLSAPNIEAFYGIDELAIVTRILGLVFVINSFGIVPIGVMYYNLNFKTLSIIGIIAMLIAAVFSVILAFMGAGVYSLVAYQLLYSILQVTILLLLNKKYVCITFDKEVFKRLFSFGIFTTISNVIDSVYENLITVIFGKMLTIAEAGYVSQSKKLEETSSQSLMVTINSTAFPILSKIKDDVQSFRHESTKLLRNIPLLIGPALIILGVYSKEIIRIILGNQWVQASGYLSIFTIAGFFMILDTLNRNFIKSLGKVKVLFFTTIIKRCIGLILIVIVIHIYSQYVLYAYVLGAFIGFICNHYMFSKLIHVFPLRSFFMVLKNMLPVILLAIVLLITYNLIENVVLKITLSTIFVFLYYFIVLTSMGFSVLKNFISVIGKL